MFDTQKEGMLMFSLVTINNEDMERRGVTEILACNGEIDKYGLSLNEEQALALVKTRTNALKETKRVEFGPGIIDKLILAFEDSPYVSQDIFEDVLHELINMFYDIKNGTWEKVSDDELIDFMKNAFNGCCAGSTQLLAGEAMRLTEHIHMGKKLSEFKLREN